MGKKDQDKKKKKWKDEGEEKRDQSGKSPVVTYADGHSFDHSISKQKCARFFLHVKLLSAEGVRSGLTCVSFCASFFLPLGVLPSLADPAESAVYL
jgi:hypothetical protein